MQAVWNRVGSRRRTLHLAQGRNAGRVPFADEARGSHVRNEAAGYVGRTISLWFTPSWSLRRTRLRRADPGRVSVPDPPLRCVDGLGVLCMKLAFQNHNALRVETIRVFSHSQGGIRCFDAGIKILMCGHQILLHITHNGEH